MTEIELQNLESYVNGLDGSIKKPVLKLIRHFRNMKLQKWAGEQGLIRLNGIGTIAAQSLQRMKAVSDELWYQEERLKKKDAR